MIINLCVYMCDSFVSETRKSEHLTSMNKKIIKVCITVVEIFRFA